jgi:hypothetical protein
MKRAGKLSDIQARAIRRLSHRFEHVARKLGRLIEEKKTVVCKRDFAGTRNDAAADEPGI